MSLNPLHVCGTRIWLNFTLKSSIIESSVMRCFFFLSSFGVFPFCNKTFYWGELSPVDGSAEGKTPKESCSECDSVTHHVVLQAVKEGKEIYGERSVELLPF